MDATLQELLVYGGGLFIAFVAGVIFGGWVQNNAYRSLARQIDSVLEAIAEDDGDQE